MAADDPMLADRAKSSDAELQAALDDHRRVPMTRLAYLLTGSVAIAEELIVGRFATRVGADH